MPKLIIRLEDDGAWWVVAVDEHGEDLPCGHIAGIRAAGIVRPLCVSAEAGFSLTEEGRVCDRSMLSDAELEEHAEYIRGRRI